MIQIENFVLDPRPQYPLLTKAKRYRNVEPQTLTVSDVADNADHKITLILAHASGFSKELWEPVMQDIFEICKARNVAPIKEIWAIDCPNHGESAVLNDHIPVKSHITGYTQLLYQFLAGEVNGIPQNYFTRHKLVGIGHSMGANALLLLKSHPSPPRWEGLVLIEPVIFRQSLRQWIMDMTNVAILQRRDIWPSKQDAFQWFSARSAFQSWDPRVLKLYCEYGLRDLPTKHYPSHKSGVTLSRGKSEEGSMGNAGINLDDTYDFLTITCNEIPVHAVYGEKEELLTPAERIHAIEKAASGRYASVTFIPDVGHYIVHCRPTRLAEVIFEKVLDINHASTSCVELASKL